MQIIADAIFDAAEKSIANKVVNIRPNDHPWITCNIKLLIRRRRIYNKFKKTKNNAAKTTSQILSLKRNPPLHPSLYMNRTPITDASSHKHLGLTFTNSCNLAEYINNITTATWTRLNLLCATKCKINRHALEKNYTSFIRPLLEYSDAVNASVESKKQLEAVHNEAAHES